MFMPDMLLDEDGFVSANVGRVKSNKDNKVNTISDDNFLFMKHTPKIYFDLGSMQRPCHFEARGLKHRVRTRNLSELVQLKLNIELPLIEAEVSE